MLIPTYNASILLIGLLVVTSTMATATKNKIAHDDHTIINSHDNIGTVSVSNSIKKTLRTQLRI